MEHGIVPVILELTQISDTAIQSVALDTLQLYAQSSMHFVSLTGQLRRNSSLFSLQKLSRKL